MSSEELRRTAMNHSLFDTSSAAKPVCLALIAVGFLLAVIYPLALAVAGEPAKQVTAPAESEVQIPQGLSRRKSMPIWTVSAMRRSNRYFPDPTESN